MWHAVRNILQAEFKEDVEGDLESAQKQGSLHLRLIRGSRHKKPLLRGQELEIRLGEEEPLALQDLQAHYRPG